MKHGILVTVVFTALTAPVYAQQFPVTDHAAHHPAQTKADATMTDGEVRRVDKDAKKLTLRHGPIKNLDMPAMTMVFQVKDPAMLDKVNVGEKIKFSAEKIGGVFTVTGIELVK